MYRVRCFKRPCCACGAGQCAWCGKPCSMCEPNRSNMKHAKVPCVECPWRQDVPLGKFPPERFRVLAPCAYDIARVVFACHMSKEGGEFACAGFLLQSSTHNLSVRLALRQGNFLIGIRSIYPLYGAYREMAIANGVSSNDSTLKLCRDDSQRVPV
jgi:hypothetical protein